MIISLYCHFKWPRKFPNICVIHMLSAASQSDDTDELLMLRVEFSHILYTVGGAINLTRHV